MTWSLSTVVIYVGIMVDEIFSISKFRRLLYRASTGYMSNKENLNETVVA